MPAFSTASAQAALERFLSLGTETASREDALVIRRARGFGLTGLAVAFLGGLVPAVIHGGGWSDYLGGMPHVTLEGFQPY